MSNTLSHILIDILDPTEINQHKITESLRALCTPVFSSRNIQLEVYYCDGPVVYVHKRGNNLLIDIIEGEYIFDKLADYIPPQYVIIRLVERGVPAEG